eukprot:7309422-Prymnesium_polylepis.1
MRSVPNTWTASGRAASSADASPARPRPRRGAQACRVGAEPHARRRAVEAARGIESSAHGFEAVPMRQRAKGVTPSGSARGVHSRRATQYASFGAARSMARRRARATLSDGVGGRPRQLPVRATGDCGRGTTGATQRRGPAASWRKGHGARATGPRRASTAWRSLPRRDLVGVDDRRCFHRRRLRSRLCQRHAKLGGTRLALGALLRVIEVDAHDRARRQRVLDHLALAREVALAALERSIGRRAVARGCRSIGHDIDAE